MRKRRKKQLGNGVWSSRFKPVNYENVSLKLVEKSIQTANLYAQVGRCKEAQIYINRATKQMHSIKDGARKGAAKQMLARVKPCRRVK